jgi:hypothetical protein
MKIILSMLKHETNYGFHELFPFLYVIIIGINQLKEKFHRKSRNIC